MGVYDTTNRLANEIKNSKEYKDFKRYMKAIKNDKVSEELLREYRTIQLQVQQNAMQNQSIDKKSMMKIETIQKKVSSNKKIYNYLISEQKFTSMMENINKILAKAIEQDYK